MKIKMIKRIVTEHGPINIGQILTVRKYPDGSFFCLNSPYQVIEGQYSGATIPLTHCILHDEEKTLSEKEWIAMENVHLAKLDKERVQKERAQQMVRELTATINKKNEEIRKLDFCINVLASSLKSCCEAIHKIKGLENA